MRKLLEPHFDVLASASNGREAVVAVERFRPDIVVLDIGMPGLNGIEACRRILESCPDTKIVFLTQQADRMYLREAFRAGGYGYVLKQSAASELISGLQSVLAGRYFVSRSISDAIPDVSFQNLACADGDPLKRLGRPLTPRQREVLQLVARRQIRQGNRDNPQNIRQNGRISQSRHYE